VNRDNNETKTEEQKSERAAAGADEERAEQGRMGRSDQPDSERDSTRSERDELRELLLRRQAEFDNFRKRTEKERSEYIQYAGTEMVRDLLPILDDFERALKVESGNAEYTRGVEMIYNRMYENLKKQGLEPVDALGKPFDHNLHQAVERVETTEHPDHTVLGEFQRGYFFKGKLLRPSMVKVAVHP
jgi:molecular chaperone GrpE